MKLWILLLFIALLSCKVQGKTQLLFANIIRTGESAKIQATCVNNDYNDAAAWITPLPTKLIKPISGIDSHKYIHATI